MNNQKIALVTGGTGGIGTAICIALADQGRKVIAGYFPPEAELALDWQTRHRANGYEFEIVACDVSDYESSKKMLHDVENTIGAVDILVNCAGITRDKTLRQMTLEQWDSVLRTNLDSAFNVTSQVVESMSHKGFGRIVNISSVNGQKGQFGQANYSASKAGVIGLTKSSARELAKRNIRVNAVAPGFIKTAMTDKLSEDVRNEMLKVIPLQRLGLPRDVANVALFLASEHAGYITGQVITVDGGMVM